MAGWHWFQPEGLAGGAEWATRRAGPSRGDTVDVESDRGGPRHTTVAGHDCPCRCGELATNSEERRVAKVPGHHLDLAATVGWCGEAVEGVGHVQRIIMSVAAETAFPAIQRISGEPVT